MPTFSEPLHLCRLGWHKHPSWGTRRIQLGLCRRRLRWWRFSCRGSSSLVVCRHHIRFGSPGFGFGSPDFGFGSPDFGFGNRCYFRKIVCCLETLRNYEAESCSLQVWRRCLSYNYFLVFGISCHLGCTSFEFRKSNCFCCWGKEHAVAAIAAIASTVVGTGEFGWSSTVTTVTAIHNYYYPNWCFPYLALYLSYSLLAPYSSATTHWLYY